MDLAVNSVADLNDTLPQSPHAPPSDSQASENVSVSSARINEPPSSSPQPLTTTSQQPTFHNIHSSDGQNHDRMDQREETGSNAMDTTNVARDIDANPWTSPSDQDNEAMDTTPDHAPISDALELNTGEEQNNSQATSPPAAVIPAWNNIGDLDTSNAPAWETNAPPPEPQPDAVPQIPPQPVPAPLQQLPTIVPPPSLPVNPRIDPVFSGGWGDGDEWFEEEDKSVPTEEELKELERKGGEVSALDHGHWTKLCLPEVEDPEYIPVESGRIDWTLKGVRGTKANPNREPVMKSPSVYIGGYHWNIKYYLKGNASPCLCAYVECSVDPPNDGDQLKTSHDKEAGEAMDTENDDLSDDMEDSDESTPPPDEKSTRVESKKWEVPAQFGLIIYNPAEPRVLCHERATHQFRNNSSDWGWKSFNNNWSTIHKRKPLQRRALLQNDTLAFTAYIRVFKDHTKRLWWHANQNEQWDSLNRAGLRGLGHDQDNTGFAAALSSWLLLAPFRKILRSIPTEGPQSKPRPTLTAMQIILSHIQYQPKSTVSVSLTFLRSIMGIYGYQRFYSMDVVELWETLRNFMAFECRDLKISKDLHELFGDHYPNIKGGMEIDASSHTIVGGKFPTLKVPVLLQSCDPHLQELIEHDSIAASYPLVAPKFLTVELERQIFKESTRKWKKIDRKVILDEEIKFSVPGNASATKYTLYGFIAHTGSLRSSNYHSILRPGGPGTKWLHFLCDSGENVVHCITNKEAFELQGSPYDAPEIDSRIGLTDNRTAAYVAMYVRNDALPDFLQGLPEPPQKSTPSKSGVETNPSTQQSVSEVQPKPEDKMFDVRIYRSGAFTGHHGPWSLDFASVAQDAENSEHVYDLTLPSSISLEDFRMKVFNMVGGLERPEQCKLWRYVQHTQFDIASYGRTALYTPGPDSPLRDLSSSIPCRFWLHIIPMELLTKVVVPIQNNHPQVDVTSGEGEMQENDDNISQTPDPAEEEDTDMPDSPHDDNASSPSSHESSESSESDDAANSASNGDTSIEDKSHPQSVTFEEPDHCYVFVKRLDFQLQTLTGTGFFMFKFGDNVKGAIKKALKIPEDKSFAVTVEDLQADTQPIRSSRSFADEGIDDGTTLIVHDVLKEKDSESLLQSASFTTVSSLLSYLRRKPFDPTANATVPAQTTRSYYTQERYKGTMLHGLYHGRGHLIKLNGDIYDGSFSHSEFSGLGTLHYANRDTYTGSFSHNLSHGHGTFEQHSTGNKYVGNFQEGKKYGKGVTYWEKSEEEMRICQICYEKEMDALFYKCGHVCACVDCARCVEVCPVCRSGVVDVVRIWKA
ncbi:MAG: hypothetical protein M1834_008060 [Cirrosporium novae-zelandiae]|nr:MAG: hypothetical protein M1834_005839 [Cirrosporium novae-zelandiae]KAI9738556.1 MAG: hypothetical protein M1834_008060 [Cirrosporium novae-zelandiae]